MPGRKTKNGATDGGAIPGNGKREFPRSASDDSGEQLWVFDRATYERDSRVVRAVARWPISVAIFISALAAVFLGLHVMDELDRRGDLVWQKIAVPTKPPPGSPLAKRPAVFPIPTIPPAALREMRDRIIKGELSQETMEQFRNFPDYDRCRRCLSECDDKAEEKAPWKAQECRRNCLRSCSEHGRALLDL